MNDYIFNPICDRTPCGSCCNGDTVKYNIKVKKCTGVALVDFVLHKDGNAPCGYPMNLSFADDKYLYFEYSHKFLEAGHYWYHFECKKFGGEVIKLIQGDNMDAIEGDDDRDFLQLVTLKSDSVDEHFRRGVIYHIFVDRFCRVGEVKVREGLTLCDDWLDPVDYEFDDNKKRINHKCYGGNFEGIISKLPYLKDLGVTTIYLSPIFEAHSSHKYNTADYQKIDEMFGGEPVFKRLLASAKKLDINIILDGVFNHTGSDSVYFNKEGRYSSLGAYNSKNSPYFGWYNFESFPNKYSSWWGVPTLPQVNETDDFVDFISGKNGVIERYMKMGVFGLRLDVADELSDEFLKKINTAVRRVNPNGVVVGEVWEDASCKIAYGERKKYFLGGELDSVTNYPMKTAIIDYVKTGNVTPLVTTINMIKSEYPKSVQHNLMNILGSHDTMRIMTALIWGENDGDMGRHIMSEEDYERGFELLKIATILQYTTLGVPTIYYGDEVGMTGGRDPFCRETYPWGRERKEILEWYKNLQGLRQIPAIYDGDIKIVYASGGVIVYEREKEASVITVALNCGESDYTLRFGGEKVDLIGNKKYSKSLELKPHSFAVLK